MRGPVLSAVVSGVMLAGIALAGRSRVDTAAVGLYHDEIRAAAARFPVDHNGWVGHEVDLPPSATKLLRPNAIVAREYRTAQRGGLTATLMLVQCADIRDMQGHYPPNCYPAHGWREDGRAEGMRFGSLPMIRYDFSQQTGSELRRIRVYNLFVLPDGSATTSMDEIRRAGSDYRARPYGAAQVQVILNETTPQAEHAWVLDQMRQIAEPVMQSLLAGAPAHRGGDAK